VIGIGCAPRLPGGRSEDWHMPAVPGRRRCLRAAAPPALLPSSPLVTRAHKPMWRLVRTDGLGGHGILGVPPGTRHRVATVSSLTNEVLVVLIVLTAHAHVWTPPRCGPRGPTVTMLLTRRRPRVRPPQCNACIP